MIETVSLAVVHVGAIAGGLGAKPLDYLDPSQFQRYLGACRSVGARYDATTRSQVMAEASRVGDLIAALKAADFAVQLDPTIAEQLQTAINAVRGEADEMRATVAGLMDSLAARGLKLWNFQLEGVAWLRSRVAGILADDMGLGKTVEALIAILPAAPVVVIAPAAVKGNWVRESNQWRKDLFPTVLSGRGSFRWALPNEVVITNYQILPESFDRKPKPGTVLIADEGHALKSASAQQTKRFRKLAKAVLENGGRVWILTGTPILNRPIELWTLLAGIGCADEAFGSWNEFKRMFSATTKTFTPKPVNGKVQKTKRIVEWGEPRAEAGIAIRKVCLRRRRTEVLPDLPTKTHIDIPVELDGEAMQIADEVAEILAKHGIDINGAVEWMKLPVVFELMSKLRAACATASIPAMLETVDAIEETGEVQIVFSAHRAPIDLLASRPGWKVITGSIAPEDRSRIVHEFQSGRLKGLGVTIKAGGVGLTLTRSHQALFVDLEWTPALNCQAEDRICRIGQDRGCIIRRLIGSHPIVEHVAMRLLEKQKLIEATVEQAAVREGGHTIVTEAKAVALEGVLAQVATIAAVPENYVRRSQTFVQAAAMVPAVDDECPF